MTMVSYCQASKAISFKAGSVVPISGSLSADIFDCRAFKYQYGEKSNAAAIDYIVWAPSKDFIAVVVGNANSTGDFSRPGEHNGL